MAIAHEGFVTKDASPSIEEQQYSIRKKVMEEISSQKTGHVE